MPGKFGLRIWGAKRDKYFRTAKERNKVTRKLRNKVTYSTFRLEKVKPKKKKRR